jgi:N-acetylglucosaminyl-diphospho-decaprenol L-rhamnosyltransferase
MRLSIIIVNWNTCSLLEECLASIYRCPPEVSFEVWVVDNASTDGSLKMLRDCFPQVNLISNSENPGFARANNQGIQQSSGDFVLLLNPDTYVKPQALDHLVRFLEANPAAGGVGARLLNPDQSLQVSCYPTPTLVREFWRLFHLDLLKPYAVYPMQEWDLNEPREVDILMGACLLLRRQTFEQIGLLDEDYFIYSEEVDLCYRVRQSGWCLYWVPRAEVVHYGGQSTRQVAEAMFLQLYHGKILYFRKHHSWLSVQLYKGVLMMAALGRLALTPLVYIEKPAKRERHLTLSNNYLRLLRYLPDY